MEASPRISQNLVNSLLLLLKLQLDGVSLNLFKEACKIIHQVLIKDTRVVPNGLNGPKICYILFPSALSKQLTVKNGANHRRLQKSVKFK
jgi:hypothetical protein